MSANLNHNIAKYNFDYSKNIRRDFHKNPELGFQEFRTSEIISTELTKFGYQVKKGVGKTGVVGFISGELPGPNLLLRFDMDALPIQEENSTDYVSQNDGVMHACGHDAHMAIGLTLAKILSENKQKINGTIKFIFQPAEEGLGGALAVIEDGVLRSPQSDYCLGLHIWNEKEIGWVGVRPGPMMAAADTFEIKILGKGGHGGLPNMAIDPTVAAAQLITSIQSIVSRNVSPFDQAVVSFGSIHGGSTFNVIPALVELTGTIRTFDPEVRQLVLKKLESISKTIGLAFGCDVETNISEITPAVINSPAIVTVLENVIKNEEFIKEFDNNFITMGSEDFSLFLNEVPGCFFFVGSANKEKNLSFGHHHPKFDFDEEVIPIAVACMLGMIDQISNIK
ncbi:MAG TPA: amidohydrolase [Anaerolineaceae bacterium]|nr:amidohydrolase [Anaerolineaceae bacterium]